jgi:hypothetical protein
MAPVAVFWSATCWGNIPTCRSAARLQYESSARNRSYGFPGVGNTRTLGPVGRVAHPAVRITNITAINLFTSLMIYSLLYFVAEEDGVGGDGTTFIQPLGHCFTYG